VLGGLFFGHEEPDRFDEESAALIEGIAALAATAMDNARLHRAARLEIAQRKAAERDRELLLEEIKHRIKNTLATVQAIASHTFAEAPASEKRAFSARLQALATAHDLLTVSDWGEVPLAELIARAIRPFEDPERARFKIDVPPASVSAPQAFALSLALHELATNAIKYGALSAPGGRVELSAADEGGTIVLTWRDCDGPTVEPPTRQGFGMRMIERALHTDLGQVSLEWPPSGLVCRICLTPT
jgi:two-component sensor histidine kinase